MGDERAKEKLALEGGLKAVTSIEGKGQPKIGVDEFMSIAERFGFSEKALAQIRKAAEADNLGEGPFLPNYYSGLKQTKVEGYEKIARRLFGAKYAIGVNSGTSALHAAFVAAGVGPGTEVICPAIGFFATAAAVVTSGAVPIFCDVDKSLMIDPAEIEPLISKRTVAIAPTHWQGNVCDMNAIMRIARQHKLKVIEDCAQACGGTFKGRPIGTFGDFGCFSISGYKIVGGGEGGLILTPKKRNWERAQQFIECGGLWRPVRFAKPRYKGELFCGTNYRMSELEAAVDVVQLGKMPAIVKRFRTVKHRILKRLKTYREIEPQLLNDPEGEVGYTLRFYPQTIELGRRIVAALQAENISAGMRGDKAAPDWHVYHSMFPVTYKTGPTEDNYPWEDPLYLQRGGSVEYNRGDCPVADDLFDRCISVRLNQWYNAQDCRNIAKGINKVLSAYCTEDPEAQPWL